MSNLGFLDIGHAYFSKQKFHTLHEKFQVPIPMQVKELINIDILNNFYENNIDNLLPELKMDNHEGCIIHTFICGLKADMALKIFT